MEPVTIIWRLPVPLGEPVGPSTTLTAPLPPLWLIATNCPVVLGGPVIKFATTVVEAAAGRAKTTVKPATIRRNDAPIVASDFSVARTDRSL